MLMLRTRGRFCVPTRTAARSPGHLKIAAFLPVYGHIGPDVIVTLGSQLPALELKSSQHTSDGRSTMQSGRRGSAPLHPSRMSLLSSVYIRQASMSCLLLFMQW